MVKPSPMGATFAERAAAARGDDDWTPPETTPARNSTFADRAGKARPDDEGNGDNSTFTSRKGVDSETEGAENKAVPSKRAAAKKS